MEWSDSLAANSWSNAGLSEVVPNDDGTRQQVKVTVPLGAGSDQTRTDCELVLCAQSVL